MSQAALTSLSGARRLSALCASACVALAALIPLAVVVLWATVSWDVLALVRLVPPDIVEDLARTVPAWQRLVGAVLWLIPALAISYGLMRARLSLTAFARGAFFAPEVAQGLRDYAAATFWAAIAGLLISPVLSLAFTWARPAGHREFSLDLSGGQVLTLVGAAIVWVIAAAMTRAAGLAHENEQFV